ncbi:choice-of-anchor C family protein [Streptomyces sp. CT34]|uniref:choice-of-anchor C family protein n=1 Tax=Streptomyces sp. CT34 TaxID=1553907 RepID=UPI0005BD3576|nr:choice-of-anchor C family protein [Streptomyces sp. CT34]
MRTLRIHVTALTAVALLAGTGSALAAPAHSSTQASRLPAPPAAVSHFDDGSFEYPTVKPKTFDEYAAGQFIGPWKVTSGTVDLIGAGYWDAAEGDQSLDLNGNNPGSVAQTFATTPGTTYTVSYSLAGNPQLDRRPAVKTGKVLIDGQDFQHFSFDVTGKSETNMGYVRRQVTFVARGRSTTLGFASTTRHSATGPVIDDVTVEHCRPSCCN